MPPETNPPVTTLTPTPTPASQPPAPPESIDSELLDAAAAESPFDEVDTDFLGRPKISPDATDDDHVTPGQPAKAQPTPVETQPGAAVVSSPTAPAAAPKETPAPAALPAATQPAGSAPAVVPAPTAPTAPSATPAPATETPGDGAAALAEYQKKAEEKLQAYFAIDQQTADELTTSPQTAVPKLMARVMFETIQATMQTVHQYLPQLVDQMEVRRTNAKGVEDRFFTQWPQLDRKAHTGLVATYARAYRQVNPQATLEDVLRDVGAQVVVALKLPAQAAAPAPTVPPVTQPPPFRPAVGAAPRTGPAPGGTGNIFSDMAEDFIAGRDYID